MNFLATNFEPRIYEFFRGKLEDEERRENTMNPVFQQILINPVSIESSNLWRNENLEIRGEREREREPRQRRI